MHSHSSGSKVATSGCKSSTEEHSRSSRCKIASLFSTNSTRRRLQKRNMYKCSTQSALPQKFTTSRCKSSTEEHSRSSRCKIASLFSTKIVHEEHSGAPAAKAQVLCTNVVRKSEIGHVQRWRAQRSRSSSPETTPFRRKSIVRKVLLASPARKSRNLMVSSTRIAHPHLRHENHHLRAQTAAKAARGCRASCAASCPASCDSTHGFARGIKPRAREGDRRDCVAWCQAFSSELAEAMLEDIDVTANLFLIRWGKVHLV